MKQEISPKVMIAVVAAVVVVAVGALLWVWRAPTVGIPSNSGSSSAFAAPSHKPSDTRAMAQQMRQDMINRRQHQPDSNSGNN